MYKRQALENIGDLVLFLVDPSESGGTPLRDQLNLLEEVESLMSAKKMIVLHSKSDLPSKRDIPGAIKVSSIESDGLEDLRARTIKMIDADAVGDPLELPDDWPRQFTGVEEESFD